MRPLTTTLLLFVLPIGASAHHSRVEYDLEAREFEGRLISIRWQNPHPGFTIEVLDNGQVESWEVEGWSSLYTFDRAGITRDRFAEGDTLKVVGLLSSRRPGRILGMHILLADGTEAVLKRDADPYWRRPEHLGGQDKWETATREALVNAADENRGIFRVWSYPAPTMQTEMSFPLTDAARAARVEFDHVDNYVTRCERKGMPASMATPNPYEFIDEGDTIRVRGYEGDVVRTVHMTGSPDPATQPPSRQGFSVGRWEDENTLVIHTSRINFPYLGFTGIPLSEAVTVEERYTLSDDQTRLDFLFTFTDPQNFTAPATYQYYWLALGETFGLYECDIH